jgi:KDO2-lipid IV(A) lauroyltransferase
MGSKLNPVHAAFSHLTVLGLRTLGAVISISPPFLWGAAATLLAPPITLLLAKHKRRALKNLTDQGYSPTEARALCRASFRSHLLVLFESLAMPRLLARRGLSVKSQITPEAEEALRMIRSGEQSLAFGVGGHTGVWEFLGAELARLSVPAPVVVSARLVKNPILSGFLVRLRQSFGILLVEKEEFLHFLLRKAREKSPHIYIFLCDQHFKDGIRIPFMGRKCCTVPVPASLIYKYDVPVFLGRCIRRKPGDYLIEIRLMETAPFRKLPRDEADRAITEAINKHIEETIALAPEQWTWAHRRWRDCCGDGS